MNNIKILLIVLLLLTSSLHSMDDHQAEYAKNDGLKAAFIHVKNVSKIHYLLPDDVWDYEEIKIMETSKASTQENEIVPLHLLRGFNILDGLGPNVDLLVAPPPVSPIPSWYDLDDEDYKLGGLLPGKVLH